MGSFPISELDPRFFPPLLSEIPDKPKKLYIRGELPDLENSKLLAVVGSRGFSSYGKAACEHLIAGLRGYPIVIVSGLAIGIDAISHEAALKTGLTTIGVPGSGLSDSVLYPRMNKVLAHKILEAGGALLSEYEENFRATNFSFPQRNRIMAGMSHATLVVESKEKSGTLITARLAMEYNRDVLTIPGQIFSETAAGNHKLIREGATLIRTPDDILEALGLEKRETTKNETLRLSSDEEKVYALLSEPKTRDELTDSLNLPAYKINITLSSLELKGAITEALGKIYRK